jgi:hypothetical protein
MAIQGTGSDTRLLRDIVQTGSRAVARKSPFATSRIRSRLRRASFAAFAWQVGIVSSSFSKFPATGDYLRLSTYSQTVSDLIGAAAFRQFKL